MLIELTTHEFTKLQQLEKQHPAKWLTTLITRCGEPYTVELCHDCLGKRIRGTQYHCES